MEKAEHDELRAWAVNVFYKRERDAITRLLDALDASEAENERLRKLGTGPLGSVPAAATYWLQADVRAEAAEAQLAALQSRYDEAVELLRELPRGLVGELPEIRANYAERVAAFLARVGSVTERKDER